MHAHSTTNRLYPSTYNRSPSKGDGYDSACAAAGQLGLMSLYETLFSTRQVATSQVRVYLCGSQPESNRGCSVIPSGVRPRPLTILSPKS